MMAMDGPILDRLLDGGPRLTAGIVTADLLNLGDEIALLERAGVELVHIDVMDGVFCPILTVGPPVVRAIRTPILKDVHLLIDDPLATIDAYVAAGADLLTFQIEGARHPHRVLRVLAGARNANDPDRGLIRGIAVTPSTPIIAIEPLLEEVEYVLILAVDPGWGGQTFIPATAHRLDQARRLIAASERRILLGVDGGVDRANVGRVARLGADIVVSGSAIFDGVAAATNVAYMFEQIRVAGRRAAVPAVTGANP
jgi:ribulose-phosphate 3-epimerase